MSIFDIFRQEKRAVETFTDEALISALVGNDSITTKQALEIPGVQYCLDIIGGTIAGLPIRLYDKDTKKEIMDDERIRLLNAETGDTLTSTQFWKAMITDYYFAKHGGMAYIRKNRNHFRGIHYVDGNKITCVQSADPIFKDYKIEVNGQTFAPFEFLKIMRRTKDGCTNADFVSENSQILASAYYSHRYQYLLMKKGGNKRGFLKSEKALSQSAMDQLKLAFSNLYSDNNESVIVLNNGIDFKEASNTSVEMQLSDTLNINNAEILELFGMNFSKNADFSTEFARAITRVIEDIECSLNRDMLLEREKGTKYFAFDTRILTRGNIRERYEAYAKGIEANILQIDEVRELEDLEPLGMKWMTLGLNQVLYDPVSDTIFTPNTKQLANLENPAEGGEEEDASGITV